MPRRRHSVRVRQSRRIISEITYSPVKHKNKDMRYLRRELAKRKLQNTKPPSEGGMTEIKFGSINLDGLDMETYHAVSEIIKKYQFDVVNQVLK